LQAHSRIEEKSGHHNSSTPPRIQKLLHALETLSPPASSSVMQFKPCMQENLTKHEQQEIKTAQHDNSSWRLPRFCHESVHHQDILLGDF
jgi:hypothetical protein